MVMPYITGPTLFEVLQQGPLNWQHSMQLAWDMILALEHCHKQGIIHRDCHPKNIIWRADRSILLDFGIARLARGGQQHTQAGMLLGTPPFIAPEQQSHPADAGPPADVYALCKILEQCFGSAMLRWHPSYRSWHQMIQRGLHTHPQRRPTIHQLKQFHQQLHHPQQMLGVGSFQQSPVFH